MKNLRLIVISIAVSIICGNPAFSSEDDAADRLNRLGNALKFDLLAEEMAEKVEIGTFGDWIASEKRFSNYEGQEIRKVRLTQELPDKFGLAARVVVQCNKTKKYGVVWTYRIEVPLRLQADSDQEPIIMYQVDDEHGERLSGSFENFYVVKEMINEAINSGGDTLLVQYKDTQEDFQLL